MKVEGSTVLPSFGDGTVHLGRSSNFIFDYICRTIDPGVWRVVMRNGDESEMVYFCPATHFLVEME